MKAVATIEFTDNPLNCWILGDSPGLSVKLAKPCRLPLHSTPY
jgi:hypothetical protein